MSFPAVLLSAAHRTGEFAKLKNFPKRAFYFISFDHRSKLALRR
jgi:hypothetical protein